MEESQVYNLPVVEPTALESMDDLLALAERRIEKIQKMITLSLKVTNTTDWVDQQGKPYLMGSGAEKVARLWGLKIHSVKSEKITTEDEKTRFYYYMVTGVAELPGGRDSIVAVGTCSSKDQFFAVGTIEIDGKKERVLKPQSEVDETNIMKSAYTNFMVNAITRLLGIRNLTFDQLKQAGIDTDKIGKVEYRGTEMSEGAKAKKDECWQKILSIVRGDEKAAKAKLKELTSWTKAGGETVTGRDDINRLSEKQIEILHGKLEKLAPSKAPMMSEGDQNVKTDMITVLKESSSVEKLEEDWKKFIPKVNTFPTKDKLEVQAVYAERKTVLGKAAK